MPPISSEALVIQKTRHVAERIVVGRRAPRTWAVWVYYGKQVLSALLTFAGGLGLGTSPPGTGGPDWSFWAGLLSLAGAAALELYRVFGVEQTAVQAMAAGRAFALVERKLAQALEEPDPTAPLNLVAEEAKALEINFYTVLPPADDDARRQAQALADDLVGRYRAGWAFPDDPAASRAARPASTRFEDRAGAAPRARFRLDDAGRPEAFPGPGEATSYAVELSLPGARPEVTNVTYVLDGSYYDPVRMSDDPANGFRQEITAAGDFLVEVQAQAGPEVVVRRAWLSELLAAGHEADGDRPEVRQALRSIEEG